MRSNSIDKTDDTFTESLTTDSNEYISYNDIESTTTISSTSLINEYNEKELVTTSINNKQEFQTTLDYDELLQSSSTIHGESTYKPQLPFTRANASGLHKQGQENKNTKTPDNQRNLHNYTNDIKRTTVIHKMVDTTVPIQKIKVTTGLPLDTQTENTSKSPNGTPIENSVDTESSAPEHTKINRNEEVTTTDSSTTSYTTGFESNLYPSITESISTTQETYNFIDPNIESITVKNEISETTYITTKSEPDHLEIENERSSTTSTYFTERAKIEEELENTKLYEDKMYITHEPTSTNSDDVTGYTLLDSMRTTSQGTKQVSLNIYNKEEHDYGVTNTPEDKEKYNIILKSTTENNEIKTDLSQSPEFSSTTVTVSSEIDDKLTEVNKDVTGSLSMHDDLSKLTTSNAQNTEKSINTDVTEPGININDKKIYPISTLPDLYTNPFIDNNSSRISPERFSTTESYVNSSKTFSKDDNNTTDQDSESYTFTTTTTVFPSDYTSMPPETTVYNYHHTESKFDLPDFDVDRTDNLERESTTGRTVTYETIRTSSSNYSNAEVYTTNTNLETSTTYKPPITASESFSPDTEQDSKNIETFTPLYQNFVTTSANSEGTEDIISTDKKFLETVGTTENIEPVSIKMTTLESQDDSVQIKLTSMPIESDITTKTSETILFTNSAISKTTYDTEKKSTIPSELIKTENSSPTYKNLHTTLTSSTENSKIKTDNESMTTTEQGSLNFRTINNIYNATEPYYEETTIFNDTIMYTTTGISTNYKEIIDDMTLFKSSTQTEGNETTTIIIPTPSENDSFLSLNSFPVTESIVSLQNYSASKTKNESMYTIIAETMSTELGNDSEEYTTNSQNTDLSSSTTNAYVFSKPTEISVDDLSNSFQSTANTEENSSESEIETPSSVTYKDTTRTEYTKETTVDSSSSTVSTEVSSNKLNTAEIILMSGTEETTANTLLYSSNTFYDSTSDTENSLTTHTSPDLSTIASTNLEKSMTQDNPSPKTRSTDATIEARNSITTLPTVIDDITSQYYNELQFSTSGLADSKIDADNKHSIPPYDITSTKKYDTTNDTLFTKLVDEHSITNTSETPSIISTQFNDTTFSESRETDITSDHKMPIVTTPSILVTQSESILDKTSDKFIETITPADNINEDSTIFDNAINITTDLLSKTSVNEYDLDSITETTLSITKEYTTNVTPPSLTTKSVTPKGEEDGLTTISYDSTLTQTNSFVHDAILMSKTTQAEFITTSVDVEKDINHPTTEPDNIEQQKKTEKESAKNDGISNSSETTTVTEISFGLITPIKTIIDNAKTTDASKTTTDSAKTLSYTLDLNSGVDITSDKILEIEKSTSEFFTNPTESISIISESPLSFNQKYGDIDYPSTIPAHSITSLENLSSRRKDIDIPAWTDSTANYDTTSTETITYVTDTQTYNQCKLNSHCPTNTFCNIGVCQNPCEVRNPCTKNASCKVFNHEAVCACEGSAGENCDKGMLILL